MEWSELTESTTVGVDECREKGTATAISNKIRVRQESVLLLATGNLCKQAEKTLLGMTTKQLVMIKSHFHFRAFLYWQHKGHQLKDPRTDRAGGALANLPLSLCHIVDLSLVPVPGPLHHLQAGQQRVLLLLQLFHLLQLWQSWRGERWEGAMEEGGGMFEEEREEGR